MALAYTNVKVEIREISLKNRPKELYEVSQKGTVPVLITIDGLVIDESLEIMLWTLKNNLNQTWLIENDNEEIEMINRNDVLFKKEPKIGSWYFNCQLFVYIFHFMVFFIRSSRL